MKIALQDNVLKLIEVDNVHFAVIKSWNKMKWNRSLKQLEGVADIELLDKLAGLFRLPAHIEEYRHRLHVVQDAVDRERMNPAPAPMFNYPVKLPLYQHQVRGANMALLTFGWADPSDSETGGIIHEGKRA